MFYLLARLNIFDFSTNLLWTKDICMFLNKTLFAEVRSCYQLYVVRQWISLKACYPWNFSNLSPFQQPPSTCCKHRLDHISLIRIDLLKYFLCYIKKFLYFKRYILKKGLQNLQLEYIAAKYLMINAQVK